MKTEIRVKDFENTEGLQNYLQTHAEELIQSTIPNNNRYNVTVTVSENAHRNQGRRPSFECAIHLKFDGLKKVYKVVRQGPHFYDVVNDAIQSLKKILRRRHNLNSTYSHTIPSLESFRAS